MASRAACPLCRERRGKRRCPAKGVAICAHCCGTKRRVEIDCPAGCVYLTGAHAAGWEGRETERNRDARRLAPHAEGLTADQGGLFLLGIATLHRLSAGGARDDRLVLQAVSTLRSTVETRTKGILYEHQAQDARAQVLAAALDEALAGSQEERRAPPDRDLLAALSALEACITATLREGPGSSTFLEMAGRIASRLPAAPDPAPQPLIVTP